MDSISIQEAYKKLCKCRETNLSLDSLADFIQDNSLDYYFYFDGYVADIATLDSILQESSIDGKTLRAHKGYLKPFESVRHIVISPNQKLKTSIALFNNKPIILFSKDLDKDTNIINNIQNESKYRIDSIYESLSQTKLIQEKLLIKSEDFNKILNIEFNESKKIIISLQNQLTDQSTLISELKNKLKEKSLEANKHLSPQEEVPSAKTRNKVIDLINVLCHMNELPIATPHVCFNIMQSHADKHGLSLPKKDFTSEWLKKINSI